ncbi:hypothetical protein [Devosia faecipullorum]|uniref:hypothetical protein n=1 Tax=Devosia faecipullorum TaxID=2755039 RepID=UPI00187B2466|nr:hypothetical protein [Devosia faecipullorum]MBE7732404.1 hypothetical protein [Devosia faecipullorum]
MRWAYGLMLAAMLAMPVSGEEIDAETDQALWCATALTMLDQMGAYPPEADNVVAVTRIWYRKGLSGLDRLGVGEDEIDAISQSYIDELGMQLPDYLISSDEEALRLNIHACFEP